MTSKWQSPATAPSGETLIVAIKVYFYDRSMDLWVTKVTTGCKDSSWIIEDFSEIDIDVIAWQPLPDFPLPTI